MSTPVNEKVVTSSPAISDVRELSRSLNWFRDNIDNVSVGDDALKEVVDDIRKVEICNFEPKNLNNLIRHEYGNIFTHFQFIVDYLDDRENSGYIRDIAMKKFDAGCSLVELLGIDFREELVDFNRLLETFPAEELEGVNLTFDDDFYFNSLEEALSIRTLLHNAFKVASYKHKETGEEFSIDMSMEEIDGKRYYFVMDDISTEWPLAVDEGKRSLYENVRNANIDGIKSPRRANSNRHGGLKMASYLAGQRGDVLVLINADDPKVNIYRAIKGIDVEEDRNMKGIMLTFPKNHEDVDLGVA